MVDFNLDENYDIQFTSSGDLDTTNTYITSLIMALLTDTISNNPMLNKEGSLTYSTRQSRLSLSYLSELQSDISDSMQFLIDDKLVIDVDVKVGVDNKTGGVIVDFNITPILPDEENINIKVRL